ARTMVNASTASTTHARKTAMNSADPLTRYPFACHRLRVRASPAGIKSEYNGGYVDLVTIGVPVRRAVM
ncbi:MAG: hypothetical protein ACR2M5_00275, partial [Nakamurella sp.]